MQSEVQQIDEGSSDNYRAFASILYFDVINMFKNIPFSYNTKSKENFLLEQALYLDEYSKLAIEKYKPFIIGCDKFDTDINNFSYVAQYCYSEDLVQIYNEHMNKYVDFNLVNEICKVSSKIMWKTMTAKDMPIKHSQ